MSSFVISSTAGSQPLELVVCVIDVCLSVWMCAVSQTFIHIAAPPPTVLPDSHGTCRTWSMCQCAKKLWNRFFEIL